MFIGRTDVEADTLILWLPDSLEKMPMRVLIEGRGEGDDRG